MKAKLEKKRLVITLPLFVEPRPSKSGKSMLVASSRGPGKTSVVIGGQPIYANVNAYFKNHDACPKEKPRKAGAKSRGRNNDGKA